MNFNIRTDLAIENSCFTNNDMPNGIERKVTIRDGIEITEVNITNEDASNRLKKPIGKYISLTVSDFKSQNIYLERDTKIISAILSSFIYNKKNQSFLVVGLGNNDITPDALGPQTTKQILSTRHFTSEFLDSVKLPDLNSVSAISPGVLGQTGIEVYEIIRSLVNEIHPSAIIVIDALASKSLSRLANCVQISDSGIQPGSGVKNARSEISKKTLGIPVIAIGIPMVIDISDIAYELLGENKETAGNNFNNMIVTPKEIDLAIEHAAKILSLSINRSLQPQLSFQDIVSLCS